MSSAKRRAKRKISLLVRMDQTRQRMPRTSTLLLALGVADKQLRFFEGCMVPLGRSLARMGLEARTRAALEDAGTNLVDRGS